MHYVHLRVALSPLRIYYILYSAPETFTYKNPHVQMHSQSVFLYSRLSDQESVVIPIEAQPIEFRALYLSSLFTYGFEKTKEKKNASKSLIKATCPHSL